MELFNNTEYDIKNQVPYDGIVTYHGKIFSAHQCDFYLKKFMENIAWKHDELVLFGKKITTKRKVAWYGSDNFEYRYSNNTKRALPWTEDLFLLKNVIEHTTHETFNSCLLNLYHTGMEGMSWHSDDEPDLKKNGAIASVSFGAERKFLFKHKTTEEKIEIILENGSLLVMQGTTQIHWQHRLPPSKRITQPRINLTFRTIV